MALVLAFSPVQKLCDGFASPTRKHCLHRQHIVKPKFLVFGMNPVTQAENDIFKVLLTLPFGPIEMPLINRSLRASPGIRRRIHVRTYFQMFQTVCVRSVSGEALNLG